MSTGDIRLKILAYSIPVPQCGCWVWTGHIDKCGYGKCSTGLAHRESYKAFVGSIPAGHEIDHKCKVRCCVNPDHLEPVTHAENVARGDYKTNHRNRTKTHCIRGHARYEGANLIVETSNGMTMRKCRECRRQRAKARPRPTTVKGLPIREYNRLSMRAWREAKKS